MESEWTEELEARLRELATRPEWSCTDIGKELGFSRSAISGKLLRLGISKARKMPPTAEELRKLELERIERAASEYSSLVEASCEDDDDPPPEDATPIPRAPRSPFGPRTMMYLHARNCRWPLWPHGTPPDCKRSLYCGEEVYGPFTARYCSLHQRVHKRSGMG